MSGAKLQALYDLIQNSEPDDQMRVTASSASPLCLAMHLDSDIRPYDHMVYLDDRLTALCNLQLYPDGPGPPPEVWLRDREMQGEFYLHGIGYNDAVSDKAYDADEMILIRPGSTETPEEVENINRVALRLAIALPPRHGKSMLVTETLPLWFLGRFPTNSVTVATYSQDFADKWGANLQDKMETVGDRLPIAADGKPLAPRSSTMSNMSFRPGKDTGEINFRSVAGALTGTGFGLGIIDDPVKGHSEALSSTERDKAGDWYVSTFANRRTQRRGAPPPLEVMMFTRWHEDDLAGRFAYDEDGETPADSWHVVRLPAIAEDNDPLGRPKGASLCPQLTPLSSLLAQQADNAAWFSCMFQGVPSHETGSMFAKTDEHANSTNTYHHYDSTASGGFHYRGKVVQGDHLLFFATVDLAASLKTSADWSVCSVWCWDSKKKILVLIDRARERVSTESHRQWLERFLYSTGRRISFVGIENKTFGTNLINDMRTDGDFLIVPINDKGDKVTKATPYAEAVRAGHVWFPKLENTSWGVSWENEHAKFPKGKHDDQVDTGAMAWTKAMENAYTAPQETKQPEKTAVQRQLQHLNKPNGRWDPYASLRTPGAL